MAPSELGCGFGEGHWNFRPWNLGLSHRAVARSLGLGLGTISSLLARAQVAELDWSQVQALTDELLERRLYRRPACPEPPRERPPPVKNSAIFFVATVTSASTCSNLCVQTRYRREQDDGRTR
jgi:hypothetical protein